MLPAHCTRGTQLEHSMTDGLARHDELLERLRGFRTAAVLIAFADLRVADALAAGPLPAHAVAERIGADPGATARFLRAAAALGLVAAVGDDRFANTPLASDALTSGGAAPLRNLVRREAAFYKRWSNLADAVRLGGRPDANLRDEDAPDWVRNFTLAGYDTARLSAPAIAEALAPLVEGWPGAVHVLDVGGGSGGYSLALAARYRQVEALIFDLPRVIETTQEIVAASGLSERVRTRSGDFRVATDFAAAGGGRQLALVFGVLVGGDADAGVALLRTVRGALAPGGHVVIRATLGDAARGADELALMDLHMLLSTSSGGAHGGGDVQSWLDAAGFERRPALPLPAELHGELLVGRNDGGR
jgi:3-hydroxy-5-methyl-1-naphthoate 3-O-methyltransferase